MYKNLKKYLSYITLVAINYRTQAIEPRPMDAGAKSSTRLLMEEVIKEITKNQQKYLYNKNISPIFQNISAGTGYSYNPNGTDTDFPNKILVGIPLTPKNQKRISDLYKEYRKHQEESAEDFTHETNVFLEKLYRKNDFYSLPSPIKDKTNGEILVTFMLELITQQMFISYIVLDAFAGNHRFSIDYVVRFVTYLTMFTCRSVVTEMILKSIQKVIKNKRDYELYEKLCAVHNDFHSDDKLLFLINNVHVIESSPFNIERLITVVNFFQSTENIDPIFNNIEDVYCDIIGIGSFVVDLIDKQENKLSLFRGCKTKILDLLSLYYLYYYFIYGGCTGSLDLIRNQKQNNIINLQEFIAVVEKYIIFGMIIGLLGDDISRDDKEIIYTQMQQEMQKEIQKNREKIFAVKNTKYK